MSREEDLGRFSLPGFCCCLVDWRLCEDLDLGFAFALEEVDGCCCCCCASAASSSSRKLRNVFWDARTRRTFTVDFIFPIHDGASQYVAT